MWQQRSGKILLEYNLWVSYVFRSLCHHEYAKFCFPTLSIASLAIFFLVCVLLRIKSNSNKWKSIVPVVIHCVLKRTNTTTTTTTSYEKMLLVAHKDQMNPSHEFDMLLRTVQSEFLFRIQTDIHFFSFFFRMVPVNLHWKNDIFLFTSLSSAVRDFTLDTDFVQVCMHVKNTFHSWHSSVSTRSCTALILFT